MFRTHKQYYQLYLLKIKNYWIQIIIGANLSFSGSSGILLFSDWLCICRILFNTTNLTQNHAYIRFGIILTEFYINFSRQAHQIELLYVSINSWDSQVSAYTPLIFPLLMNPSLESRQTLYFDWGTW